MGCGLWSFSIRMRCMFLIRNYFPGYYMQILINLELCNIGIPKVIASYVLEKKDWEPILRFIEDGDIDMYILEEDFCADKIHINKNTLFAKEITDAKKIDSFLTLYGREYYTFDLLAFIKNNMKKPRSPVEEDQKMPFEMEESYYLESKKNTPEFSSLDDEKIKQIIRETKKTMKLFKDS
jgi:hypothetical protein